MFNLLSCTSSSFQTRWSVGVSEIRWLILKEGSVVGGTDLGKEVFEYGTRTSYFETRRLDKKFFSRCSKVLITLLSNHHRHTNSFFNG